MSKVGPIESAFNAYILDLAEMACEQGADLLSREELTALPLKVAQSRERLGAALQYGARNLTKIDPEYDVCPLTDLMSLGDALRGKPYEAPPVTTTLPVAPLVLRVLLTVYKDHLIVETRYAGGDLSAFIRVGAYTVLVNSRKYLGMSDEAVAWLADVQQGETGALAWIKFPGDAEGGMFSEEWAWKSREAIEVFGRGVTSPNTNHPRGPHVRIPNHPPAEAVARIEGRTKESE